jgi:PRTRC genetic system protein C
LKKRANTKKRGQHFLKFLSSPICRNYSQKARENTKDILPKSLLKINLKINFNYLILKFKICYSQPIRKFYTQRQRTGNKIPDPEPKWSVEAVMNFYANTYPILTTAKVSAIKNDTVQYKFESVMGTKG